MAQRHQVNVDGEEAGYAEVIPPPRHRASAFSQEEEGKDPLIAMVVSLMDDIFRIPGTKIRFGLDPLMGLFPGVGDALGSIVSVALLGASARHGVPKIVLARMALNILINGVVGAIPFFGDAFSVWFKSNAMNERLLLQHAGKRRASTVGDWVFVCGLIFLVPAVIGLALYGVFTLIRQLFLL